MQKFSERKGFTKPLLVIQIEGMTVELRNSLWNALHEKIWMKEGMMKDLSGLSPGEIVNVAAAIWADFFKKPIDEIVGTNPAMDFNLGATVIHSLKSYFYDCEWYEVYDFIQFIINNIAEDNELEDRVNYLLEREFSGYRFIHGVCTDNTAQQEIEALEEAIGDNRFKGVSGHLKRALELMSDRKNPDYRNSIKESISAVESMVREIVRNEKDTLGKALVKLEKDGKIHKSLKDGFSKMYGYTSDEGGIRHAMMDESNVSADDAKFFLLSCTSFINYLKTKM
jgi:AbiJ N-terminal domain 4